MPLEHIHRLVGIQALHGGLLPVEGLVGRGKDDVLAARLNQIVVKAVVLN